MMKKYILSVMATALFVVTEIYEQMKRHRINKIKIYCRCDTERTSDSVAQRY